MTWESILFINSTSSQEGDKRLILSRHTTKIFSFKTSTKEGGIHSPLFYFHLLISFFLKEICLISSVGWFSQAIPFYLVSHRSPPPSFSLTVPWFDWKSFFSALSSLWPQKDITTPNQGDTSRSLWELLGYHLSY